MSAIEVFWVSGSPFSWRVMLALEVKGLPYQAHLVEMSKGEQRTPAFLAMNPRGQVPVLRDGPVVVSESIAILAYLERQYPEPPLFGRTPAEAAAIWQEVMQGVLHVDRFEEFILPFYFGRSVAEEAQVRAALPHIERELGRLEARLGDSPWLAAAQLSAADLTVYPLVRSLLRAAEKPEAARFEHDLLPLNARRPHIAAWMARIEGLPGYERTFPPHWRR
jgi:glutathione S-transferase